MNLTSSTALSGLQASQTQLAASAHNIANLNTPDFKRQTVQAVTVAPAGVKTTVATEREPGPALVRDVVDQMQATHSFAANLAVFQSQDKMMGALLNLRA